MASSTGPWVGTWKSDWNGHEGPLWCIVSETPNQPGSYDFRYRAGWGVLKFGNYVHTVKVAEKTPEAIVRVAFDLARTRGKKVHSAEKNNVMKTGVLWKKVATETHKQHGQGIELHHILADNCAMQLIRNPKQFDVIVTDNLFGDILSDAAAMLTGSLGMLPSASLGDVDATGRRKALYEPVHGSAPDIAGRDVANPIATLLSFAMCLRYSFDLDDEARLIETAITNVLAGGLRTADIMQPGKARVSTWFWRIVMNLCLDAKRRPAALQWDAFLRLFDFPAAVSTAEQRAVSTVPQQYLFMMNSAGE